MRTINLSLIRIALAGFAATAIVGPSAAVDYAARSIPTKIEIWPIPSQTVTAGQFLTGQPGTPVTVGAELRLPQSNNPDCPACYLGQFASTERLPTVVLLHGGGGVIATQDTWAGEFLERGFAVLIVDSNTARGRAAFMSVIIDAYAALAILANHPRVDPTRIIAMGWSLGGSAALYGALSRFDQLWNTSGIRYAAHIAITPNCGTTYIDETAFGEAPIRIFAGVADEANPVEQCQGYADRVRAAGLTDIEFTAYVDARHAFGDRLNFAEPITMPNPHQAACNRVEGPVGVVINTATGQPFTNQDACVDPGPQVFAHQPEAEQALYQAVIDFAGRFMTPQ